MTQIGGRHFSPTLRILNTFNILPVNVGCHCGGCRARLKAMDLGSDLLLEVLLMDLPKDYYYAKRIRHMA